MAYEEVKVKDRLDWDLLHQEELHQGLLGEGKSRVEESLVKESQGE